VDAIDKAFFGLLEGIEIEFRTAKATHIEEYVHAPKENT